MAERVAEVKQGAPAVLPLVLRDDCSLELAVPANDETERRGVHRHEIVQVLFEPYEEVVIQYQAVFDDLGEPRGKFSRWQCLERIGVCHYASRLVERADHVLGFGMVDRRLAADRGIYLCEQGRRYLDIVDAALIARCGEAADITDDPAAQRHETCVAMEAVFHERIDDRRERLQGFVVFAIGQNQSVLVVGRERPLERGEIQWRDDLIRDDQDLASRDALREHIRLTQQPRADEYRVTPFSQ